MSDERQVTKMEPRELNRDIARMSEASAFLQMVERVAQTPGANVDIMRQLLDMQERVLNRQAKAAYVAALSQMQPFLPTVEKNGTITIIEKGGTKVIQSTPYALWEDINEAMRPVLGDNGFALSFRCGTTAEGKITVTGILSHEEGHQEETTIVLTHDSTGSKNAVQAVGSSISYGKRYTAGLLLNITSRASPEGDDDGVAAGAPASISAEQRNEIQMLLDDTNSDVGRFCKFMNVDTIDDIPAAQFKRAIDKLKQKKAQSS